MHTEIITFGPNQPIAHATGTLMDSVEARRQRIYPVVDDQGVLHGVIPRSAIFASLGSEGGTESVSSLMVPSPVVSYVGETLRSAADRMAEFEVGAVPVVQSLSGKDVLRRVITEFDILRSRQRQLIEERKREVILGRYANRYQQ